MMGWEEIKKEHERLEEEELNRYKKFVIETIEKCQRKDFRFVREMYIRATFQKCEMDVEEEMGLR